MTRALTSAAAVAAVAFAATAATNASAYDVVPTCTSASLPGDTSCDPWYRSPVTLTWSWTPTAGVSSLQGCGNEVISSDARAERSCDVSWGGQSRAASVTVKVDQTAPIVTAAVPDRRPDVNGWYNHPVGFTVSGSDAMSGIGSCPGFTYSGPDGPSVAAVGTCTDLAGNFASAPFPLAYDATPPVVRATPGRPPDSKGWYRRAVVFTFAGSDAASGVASCTKSRRYRGPNSASARVTGSCTDNAGNTATVSVPLRFDARPPVLRLGSTGTVATPPRLRWRAVRGARYYNVQLYRLGPHGGKLLSTWPHHARLQLHRAWRYRGRAERLAHGRYRWYVWPGFGSLAAHRYGHVLGSGTFRMRGPARRRSGASRPGAEVLVTGLARVAHLEGAIAVVRLGPVVAGLERERVAAVVARAPLRLVEQRKADARAARRFGHDQVRDPRLLRGPVEARAEVERAEAHHALGGLGDDVMAVRVHHLVVPDRAAVGVGPVRDDRPPELLQQALDRAVVVAARRANPHWPGSPCSSAPFTDASRALSRYSASASGEPKRRPGRASAP